MTDYISKGNFAPGTIYSWTLVNGNAGNWYIGGTSTSAYPSTVADDAELLVPAANRGYAVAVEGAANVTVGQLQFNFGGLTPAAYYQDVVVEVLGAGSKLDVNPATDFSGAAVTADGSYDAFLNIAQGGTLELNGSTPIYSAIMFGTYTNAWRGAASSLTQGTDTNNNKLIIDDPTVGDIASPIYGLVGNNEIILSSITYSASDKVSVSVTSDPNAPTNGTWALLNGAGFKLYDVTIENSVGTVLETLTLSAPNSAPLTGTDGTQFTLFSAGGDLGVEGTAPVCFAAGTRILTAKGEIPVEQLTQGDEVITARGELRSISWIGHLHINLTRHARPEAANPIRIKANALADGMPHRDLIVSPDHAFLLDGLLIEAKHLVNGATIIQETRNAITYYHVELESHDILLAEGAHAESYLESDNRKTFDNAGAVTVLHPVFETAAEGSCYPRKNAGPAVEAVRDRLRRRALGFGFAIRNGMEAWAESAGRRIAPANTEDGLVFRLDAASGPVRLRSASGIPAELSADPRDRRSLGLSVLGVAFAQGETRIEIPLESECLAEGFYAAEQGKYGQHRWTNGNAAIVAPPGIDAAQPFTLTLRIAGAMQSWQPAIAA